MLLLREQDCPHVIGLHDFFFAISEDASHTVFVLEAFPCTLRALAMQRTHVVSRLRQARVAGRQIAAALSHVHSMHILHRDVKSDNVLCRLSSNCAADFERPTCVLSDFGASTTFSEPAPDAAPRSSMCFALHVRPPELLFGSSQYLIAPDIWAAACTIAEVLLGGTSLFAPSDDEDTGGEQLDSPERQLHALFENLGTPSWDDIIAMNPQLNADHDRARAWMQAPPRPPTRGWRERLLSDLLRDEPTGRTAVEGPEAAELSYGAASLLAAIFQWSPAARPTAQAMLSDFRFLCDE